MLQRFELLLIGFFFIQKISCCSDDVSKPRIAIVGAGIGGASASQFLTELLDGNLEIDIFESNEIGGRVATVKIGDNEYDTSGSLTNIGRGYITYFTKLLEFEESLIFRDINIGIWTGDEIILRDKYATRLVPLIRYVDPLASKMINIYRKQIKGEAYDNLTDLISAMSPELAKLLQVSTAEYLQSSEFTDKVSDELVKACLNAYYGQNATEIHSFLSVLYFSDRGDTWSIKGAAKEVPEQLIYRNSKVNLVRSQVEAIRYFVDNESLTQYEISFDNQGDNETGNYTYDIVIIATPLTEDQEHSIEFVGFPENVTLQFPGNYLKIVTTFVEGDIDPSYFGLKEPLDYILCSDPNRTLIDYIERVFPIDGESGNSSRVWKLSTKEHLTSDQIGSIFSQVDQVKEMEWMAYPKYSTIPRSDKFELYDSLYHVNAIEWAVSSMDMSAMAAKNVALLIRNKLASCCRDSSAEEKLRCKYSCKEYDETEYSWMTLSLYYFYRALTCMKCN